MKPFLDHDFDLYPQSNQNPRDAKSVRKEITMKNKNFRLFVLGFAFVSIGVVLAAAVPNSFTSGEVISSSKVNANFTALTATTTALENKTGGFRRIGEQTFFGDQVVVNSNSSYFKNMTIDSSTEIPLLLSYTGNSGFANPELYIQRNSADFGRIRFFRNTNTFWDVAVNDNEFRIYNNKSQKDIFVVSSTDSAYNSAKVDGDLYVTGNMLGNVIGTLTAPSDKNIKTNFSSINTRDVLKKVSNMAISSWRYKTEPKNIRHVGVMAQDFYKQFGLGADNKHINTIDADGVMVASIQALNSQMLEKDAKILKLEKRVSQLVSLEARLSKLELSRR